MQYTIAIDAGNGIVNAVRQKGKRYTQFSEPSVRAPATGDSLGLGKGYELDIPYLDWYGTRYMTGDHAVRYALSNLQRHMGGARYGNPFHQMLVANACANLGVKSGEVDLTLFAPPGMYRDALETMQSAFSEGDVTITLKGDKKPRKWRYSHIRVRPEGLAAVGCFALDNQGRAVNADLLAGDVLVIDVGAYTLDAILLKNGNFNPEALDKATWENDGVDAHIRQPLVRDLRNASSDMAMISPEHVDYIIRHGAVTGDYTIERGGYSADLGGHLKEYSRVYAEVIADTVIDSAFNRLRGIKACIVVGGGAGLVEGHLRYIYGDKILDRPGGIAPGDMNAVGGLRLTIYEQNMLQ